MTRHLASFRADIYVPAPRLSNGGPSAGVEIPNFILKDGIGHRHAHTAWPRGAWK